ncbi:MAG: Flp pilus assembly complex ATPase component TadA, partial [Rhodanobacteraceae bacterium]|nr:Flp pilus assembly complex ATPase component TadA [Rhodanobacteraceae bacterium]
FDVTLRVLRSGGNTKIRTVDSLGYDANQQAAIDRMLQSRTGLIVMCGSTGSGKSTTLGALLHALALRHGGTKKIRTIEDPPELVLPGRQTPVVRDANGKSTGFAAALRAAMRGDPDIIMIGEVRDNETGELVMDASMTGHKVLTTVHGGSPFDALDRLVKKGFDRSVLFAEGNLSGVIYQCLLPVLCPDCSIPFSHARLGIPEGLRMRLRTSYSGDQEALRFRGNGCETCKHEGIIGRTVCASFLVPDRHLRSLLLNNDRFAAEAYWIENEWSGKFASNGRTVLDQALEKMGQGLVSPLDVELELAPIDSQEPRENASPVNVSAARAIR